MCIDNSRRTETLEFGGGIFQIRRHKQEPTTTLIVKVGQEFSNSDYGVQLQIGATQPQKCWVSADDIPEIVAYMLDAMPEEKRGELLLVLKDHSGLHE